MWQVEYFHLFTEVHIILSVSTLRYNLHIVKTSQRVSRVCSVPSVTLRALAHFQVGRPYQPKC